MTRISIQISENDKDFINLAREQFGENITVIKRKGIDGCVGALIVVIPVAQLTIAIIDFFLNHVSKRENNEKNADKENNKGRVIITPKGKISLEGYSASEVKKILQELTNIRDD